MTRLKTHTESHATSRIGWLRAAVMGANDGIVSTASLIVGVAAASAGRSEILVAGMASLFAGAMSMAAGEYVSVSSQADTEFEHQELAAVYEARGVDAATAGEVARQMMAHDALAAHARDELGISDISTARPLQAAIASALTFTAGAAAPLLVVPFAPLASMVMAVAAASLVCLAVLGALGAKAGGAPLVPSVLRVVFWGAMAMVITALVGKLFGAAVA